MAGDWSRIATFAELIAEGTLEIGDGYRAKNEELGGDGPIFLRAGHVTDARIDFSGADRFHAELEPRVRSKFSMPGDAVVTTKGNSTGRTTFVTSSMPTFVYSPHLSYWRSRNLNRIEGGFLRYWSRGPEFTEQLAGMKASTDMAPYLSLIDQKRLRITLPTIHDQRSIARILGTLDDKIELNQRMSETLEAMARALFTSWFVDFDPVRAKAEGCDPGLPSAIADLFPDTLIEHPDMGEIPDGWEVGSLGDLVDLLRDQVNPQGSPKVMFRHFSIPAFDQGQWPKSEIGENIKSQKSRVRPGSVLLSKLNPEIERVWLVDVADGDRAVCSTEFLVLLSRLPVGRLFVYCLGRSPAFRREIEALVTGTSKSHQRARADALLSLATIVPPTPLAEAFEKLAAPILHRTLATRRETRMLTDLRDTLLPKLISGELRLVEPERILRSAE